MPNDKEQQNMGTAPAADNRAPRGRGGRPAGGKGDFRKNPRKGPRREARVKPEFDHKIVSIRRVARVVAGGRRFSFSVVLVAGNRKGQVGVGIGKAGDTPLAIEKAMRDAKRNMIRVSLTKSGSIPHEVEAKYSSARVLIKPAPGKGVIAGSSVRNVLELAGIKEVSAKIFSRTKNQLNNARSAVKALSKLAKVKEVAVASAASEQ
ncbi:MAG TPA: 30S ribosomal protein S5 [Candidatus Paceibacterota bacterium]|nr:30S ribosomal protein S5 [Candidatus Paceibacterota bacterium]